MSFITRSTVFALGMTAATLGVAPGSAHAQITAYYQDFESLDQSDPAALNNEFSVGANVFLYDPGNPPNGEGAFQYDYFAFPAPNGGPAFSGITDTGTGAPLGDQGLVVYSDYNNGDHGNGRVINALVFQSYSIDSSNIGEIWEFSFVAAPGDLVGPSTAYAFIKTLNPAAGFATTNLLQIDTTSLPAGNSNLSLQLEITPDLDGQLFQIGFENWATAFNASGVNYDNVSLALVPEPSSLALLGLGGLALMRRRRA